MEMPPLAAPFQAPTSCHPLGWKVSLLLPAGWIAKPLPPGWMAKPELRNTKFQFKSVSDHNTLPAGWIKGSQL